MLTRKIHTIEEHQKIVGSRFQLAQIIMKRTNELLRGEPVSKGLGSEFSPKKNGGIPSQQYHRIALEELRTGKIKWRETAKDTWEEQGLDTDTVIFGE